MIEEVTVIEGVKGKRFYKKNWFLLVAVGLVSCLVGVGIGYETAIKSESQATTAIPVDLTTGTWTCGVDIAPGRYTVTAVDGSGNLYIEGSTDVAAILGNDVISVPSVTVTIEEGDVIEIANMPAAHFEPVVEGDNVDEQSLEAAGSEMQVPIPVDLKTGTWICGVDIAPGKYTATPATDSDSGLLIINGSTYINESFGDGDSDVSSVTFTIQEGDTIKISKLDAVHFEPVE